MNNHSVAELLVEKGKALFHSPRVSVTFTTNAEADKLLNDIENTPHAFVVACIMDRQIKAETAWSIPYLISEKLGDFKFPTLAALSLPDVENLMTIPTPLHRFPSVMSENFYRAIQTIAQDYSGLASNIWCNRPSSADVVYRFLRFKGVGQKIATMATNILARDFKIEFSDYYSIDVSVDVHIKRVFYRLGLIPAQASNEQIVYRARAISQEFPGLVDLPLWEIGRNWCKASEPNCPECYMQKVCPKIV
jgi:endonuclease III